MHPLVHWIREVEETGGARGITVLAAGSVISGTLCPFSRYARWRDELHRRAVLAGGRFGVPAIEIPPLTEAERGECRREWQHRLTAARAAQGFPSDDEELSGLFDYFALANARIRLDRYEFIVVATASVGAYYPGQLSHRDGGA
jgi:hypothetical protein